MSTSQQDHAADRRPKRRRRLMVKDVGWLLAVALLPIVLARSDAVLPVSFFVAEA